ncbi:class I SAM-dependent methyltransferase [Dongia sedimenti]|uniref:Class I SAM-dependent methyltransferase n=1 Tax=Dongia sedimenti TaxID=3064282 RepID=A0ABU0YM76_9PROT|nr:class I SAM-dependent methyltransferase [Rhodospirillaceae bacterium R-7]
MKTVRDHDKLYLAEQRYDKPKEIFKFMANCIEQGGRVPPEGAVVCDVGCAAGELAYYLRMIWPQARVVGYDLLPELVERARSVVQGAEFNVGSALDPDLMPEAFADVIFMSGVLSIFDEYKTALDNVVSWLKPGGRAIVFGIFNPEPVDVIIRSRASDAGQDAPWETGWNVFSTRSISGFLERHPARPESVFHRFSLPIDLPQNPDDPLRSWTIPLADGNRMIVNGLCLVHHFMALEIRRPS